MKKELVTREGYKKLWERKKSLEKEIADATFERGEASGQGGGWHENNQFEFLEEKLHHLTSRLYEINNRILNSEIIEVAIGIEEGIVDFGSTVQIEISGQIVEYKIMGEAESDFQNNIISYNSPLGKAVFKRQVGETVSYSSPSGEIVVRIVALKK